MNKLNTAKRERRWRRYHGFEAKNRFRRLRNLSVRDSFEALKELYYFISPPTDIRNIKKMSMLKIEVLSRVHSMFNKVRP